MVRLEIEILGDVRFRLDGAPWRLNAPPKCLPLLALIATRREPLTRVALASTFWPDETEPDARANLRRHLYALTRALPHIVGVEWIRASTNEVAWNHAAPARVDALEFEERVANDDQADEATRLYRGDLLAGTFDESIIAERDRLQTLQLGALLRLARSARTSRNYAVAVGHAQAILDIDEFREDAVRLLIEVRHASGDRSGALTIFERFARRLRDELGADPMFETLALRDAVVADADLHHAEVAPSYAPAARTLVGRTDELEMLSKAWLRAARGSGGAVFLAGEAGVGKSRLADELLRLIDRQGGRTVVGSTSSPESIPYQPVVEVLRAIIPFVPREARHNPWLAALLPFIPAIRTLHPDVADAAPLKSEPSKQRLHDAVARAIEVGSRIRPIAMLLEDVHHANVETLELIRAVAERLSGTPALLLLTYRSTDVESDSPLRILRRTLQRTGVATHHALARLLESDIAKMIASEGIIDDGAFASRVFGLSAGNPLFASQLIRHRQERGSNHRDDAAVHTIGEAIRTRIALLPPFVRGVADVAATIGDTFTVEEISEVCGLDEAAVFAGLATLLDRNLVAERAGISFEYGFAHALIANVIYEATDDDARKARHHRCATVLGQTRGADGRSLALIASHWERAGDPASARAAYLQAARTSFERFARDEAISLAHKVLQLEPTTQERFVALLTILQSSSKDPQNDASDRALAQLEAMSPSLSIEERFEVLAAREELHSARSERVEQSATIERLVEVAGSNPNLRARASLCDAAHCLQRGDTAQAAQTLRAIEPMVNGFAPSQVREFYRQLATALFRSLRFDEARSTLDTFREYLTEHPSPEGELAYITAELAGAWVCDNHAALARTAESLIRLAGVCADPFAQAHGHANLAFVRHQLHDTAGAREEYQRTLALYERLQHHANTLITRFNYGLVEFECGHIERAAKQWEIVGREAANVSCGTLAIAANINLAEVELTRGNLGSALMHARAAYTAAKPTGDEWIAINARVALGTARARSGNTKEGLTDLRIAVDLVRGKDQSRTFIGHLATYIEELVRANELTELGPLVAELHTAFEANPKNAQYPPLVCWVLACAATACGDAKLADTMYERGYRLVQERARDFSDSLDREAFLTMHPHQLLLARAHVPA